MVKGFGLVAAITDLGGMDWNSAKTACDELILNGYSDWHLPSKEELNALYVILGKPGIGGFVNKKYWSKSYADNLSWAQYFESGSQSKTGFHEVLPVRAVRSF